MPQYFDKKLFTFLRQLKRNNNRDWFNDHKDQYEAFAKEPMLQFVSDVRAPLLEICPQLRVVAKASGGSMMRIYRDIRFSEDKTPYKTNLALFFPYRPAQQKIHSPGYYLHLEPGKCFMGAGVWRPDSPVVYRIRKAIADRPEEWGKIRRKKIEIQGDSLKKVPRGFDPEHPYAEDLKRKDFVSSIDFTDEQVCSPQFLKNYVKACRKMEPLMEFLCGAMGFRW